MNPIVKMSENVPQPASESAALIALIERLARDPSADLSKMERLLEMRERIVTQEVLTRFNNAMSAAQSEMTQVSVDAANPQTKSRYASFAAIDRALRPIYTRHGFSISFDEGEDIGPERIRVLAYVAAGGHSRTYHLDMPADGKGAKGGDVMTKTHATGSAVTYGRRYLLMMIFNIAVGDDDDGNAAGRKPRSETVNADQVDALQQAIMDAEIDIQIFYDRAKIKRLEELPAIHFGQAMQWIKDRKTANERDRPAFA